MPSILNCLVPQIFVVFCLLAGADAWAQPVGSGREATEQARTVESYLLEQMRLNHIPSVSVAVVRDGTTELLSSYGTANLEWDAASTLNTAYQLASATKPLTGTALMLLVQDGDLALDDSVAKYVSGAPKEWGKITIRHLVTHSSGITDDLGNPKTTEEAVRGAAGKPLIFEPGSRSSYGIGGYAVLQHIIELVSGSPFPEFLRERLLDPLGMTNTRFDKSSNDGPFRIADVVPRRAGIYSREGDSSRVFWFHYDPWAYTAGGLLSTAEDLARWAAALDGGGLLSDESLKLMLFGSEGSQFGFGWVPGNYRGRRTSGHSGGPALADILRFPDEQLTIIVLTNQTTMYPYLAQGIADILLPAPSDPAPAALTDSSAAHSGLVAEFLMSISRGDVPEEAFTAEARAGFVPQLESFLIPYARSLGPPTALSLIEERTENGLLVRVYRAMFRDKAIRWRFDFGPDRLIASLRPTPE